MPAAGCLRARSRQRRHLQLDDVQPVEEVFAEAACADGLAQQVGVGGATTRTFTRRVVLLPRRSNSPVCSTRSSLAWPASEQIADLVEEQRAAVGGLEAALRAPCRAGVRAGLGAEQLGLDQLSGSAPAFTLMNGPLRTRRVRLDDRRPALPCRRRSAR